MQRGSIRLFSLVSLLCLGACADGTNLPGQITDHVLAPSIPDSDDGDSGEPADDIDTGDGTDGTGDGHEPAPGEVEQPAPGDGDGDGSEPSDDGDGPVAGSPDTWQGMRVGTNFWYLASWAEDAWASNVDFATTSDPWNPAFIADLEESHYAVFRFMDFGGTNSSTIRSWSERTQKTSPDNQGGGDVGGRGIAYEWMFDLCNRLQTDCWVTVPHLAIEDYEQNPEQNYFTELAKLAKEELDPGLKLYVEFSNETWNPGFQQALYGQQRGTQMGLAGDAYGASFKFHVYASSRLYDAFVKVYGDDIERVRWVVAGQLGSAYGTELQVQALADANINVGGRTPDFYAISNYVGSDGSLDGAAGDVVERYRAGIAQTMEQARAQKALTDPTGMRFISYEGGQHITTNAADFSRNPAAYDLYKEWLDQSDDIFALTTHYGHAGGYGAGGAWGSKEYSGQPLSEAHKARALLEYIAAHQ